MITKTGWRFYTHERALMTRQSGSFVYTGSGNKQSADADPALVACKKFACNIQWCMAKHNSQQDKCVEYVNAWKECFDLVNKFEAGKKSSQMTAAGK